MNPWPISKGPPSRSTGQAAGSAVKMSMAEARDRASAMLIVSKKSFLPAEQVFRTS